MLVRSSVLVVLLIWSGAVFALPGQQITWIQNPANGHRYGVGPNTTSWSAGETLAVSLGGHLATIRSASEQTWIEANFGSYLGTHGLWIGFNDLAVEGQWQWVSGEPVTYTNWAPGNPNNGSTIEEDAAHLYGPIGGVDLWKWNDETEWFANILRPLIELPGPFTPASYSPFGSGCPGAVGVPQLQPLGNELPRLGTTSHLRLSNLATTPTLVIMVIGFSTTANSGPLGSYPLPRDLAAIGMPGCQQLVSDNFTNFLLALGGQVDWPFTVPPNPGFAGLVLHVQALAQEIQPVPALSNGVTATVGY